MVAKDIKDYWIVLFTDPGCEGALYYFYDNWRAASAHTNHLEELIKKEQSLFTRGKVQMGRMSGIVRSEFPQ